LAYFWTPPFHEGKGPGLFRGNGRQDLWAIQFVALIAAALGSLFFASLKPNPGGPVARDRPAIRRCTCCSTSSSGTREPIMPLVGVIAALAVEALLPRENNGSERRRVTRSPWADVKLFCGEWSITASTEYFEQEVLRKRPYFEKGVVHARSRQPDSLGGAGEQQVPLLGRDSRAGRPFT